MTIQITVPRVLPSHNDLRGKYKNHHAYKDLRDGWQHDIFYLCGAKDSRILRARKDLQEKAVVRIHSQRKKLLDKDGLYGGAKPVLDCLTRLEYIVDDSEEWIDFDATQEIHPDQKTIISIIYNRP